MPRFTRSFTQQEPLPPEAQRAALAVMQSGRLHRYNTAPGERSEAAALEAEFAEWQGARFCLAVGSGGQAMQIALRAGGVGPGDSVLTNAFTLAPVPGAIAAVGARPVLVEITPDLVLDLDDLAARAAASGARVLLLSHMRGHLCDMEALMALADRLGLTVIEDCAHTMGARFKGRRAGGFGRAACFSTQTYKHINSGEGGLLTTDDANLAARATILSGSYMLYDRHGAGPDPAAFVDIRLDTPNMSARMDNLRAAVLRPQLATLEANVARWGGLYDRLARGLQGIPGVALPRAVEGAARVGSSLQFRLDGIDAGAARAVVAQAAAEGVELKWFGAPEPAGFTSAHPSWRYVAAQHMPATDSILAGLFDLRLPLTFTPEDCDVIAAVIAEAIAKATG
ncbi:aminotransferase [Palleronia sediminis]|uniref:Aminotransferase n=1 Tax=Palleronia sediminis TaxID=2547833 RepID=A0A4R6A787_9RHOB|nr:DegT/DnrJ/EryC1/StrS family aminotransferase [Palleronia sediminis]TDL79520.1 aminotransferase [Palleronia sediminis]